MLQRIQTLYFLIVTVLMSLALCFNLAKITTESEIIALDPFGLTSVTGDGVETVIASTPQMGVLTLICAIMSFIMIFLYHKRMLQVRLCFALMILLAGVQAFFVFYAMKMNTDMTLISYKLPCVFPVISIILIYLAFRGVIRDEMLIRSLNRIR